MADGGSKVRLFWYFSHPMTTSPADAPGAAVRVTSPPERPPDDKIRQHLQRIFESAAFTRSNRMISFLRFVVETKLAGDTSKLTEREIGQEIFGRPTNWDPSIDTIVRSEARRLRSKLHAYYTAAGHSDTIRIDMPKGGYVPVFTWATVPALEPTADVEVHSSPHAVPRFGKTPWILAAACGLIAVAVIAVLMRRSPAMQYRVQPVTSDLGQEFSPALSPDGKQIAYVARSENQEAALMLKPAGGGDVQRLTAPDQISLFPAWSADGQQLAFLNTRRNSSLVQVMSLRDKRARTIASIGTETGRWSDHPGPLLGNPGPSWTPDGRHLVVSDYTARDGGGLVLLSLSGQRIKLTKSVGEERDFSPKVSPDGRSVAFIRYLTHDAAEVFTVDIHGGKAKRITTDRRSIQDLAWNGDGHSLLVSSNRDGAFALWRIALNGASTRLPISTVSARELSVARNTGAIAFVESGETWNIWRAPLGEKKIGAAALFLASSGRNYDPRYSPDGRQIAFVSDRSGTMQLWIAAADGTHAVQRTNLPGSWVGGISWSPDSEEIAFDARPKGHSSIYLLHLRSSKLDLLDDNDFEERMPAFSKDGESIYFNSTRDGSVAIWQYNLKTRSRQRFTLPGAFAAQESPSGNGLIYGMRTGELLISTSPQGAARRLGASMVYPALSWFVAPSGLYFTKRADAGVTDLCKWSQSAETCFGPLPKPLVPNLPDIAVSPDGKWLMFTAQDALNADIKLALPQ